MLLKTFRFMWNSIQIFLTINHFGKIHKINSSFYILRYHSFIRSLIHGENIFRSKMRIMKNDFSLCSVNKKNSHSFNMYANTNIRWWITLNMLIWILCSLFAVEFNTNTHTYCINNNWKFDKRELSIMWLLELEEQW